MAARAVDRSAAAGRPLGMRRVLAAVRRFMGTRARG